MTNTKIELKNIHKSFGSNHVLRGLDLAVEEGRSHVIIGGSGSGKSVILKTILGFVAHDQGSLKIDGVEMTGLSSGERDKYASQINMLFQAGALFDGLPVWQNIAFMALNDKTHSPQEARALAIEKLSAVGLGEGIADLMPSELSGGMQKRVSLARTIASNPKIMFFDEPTTGLDPIMSDVINNLIVKCVKELGATAISITHDMASATKIADHISMIYEGKMIWTGPSDQIYKSGNEYVDQFVHGRADGPIQMQILKK